MKSKRYSSIFTTAIALALTPAVQAAVVSTSQTFSSDPPVADVYFYVSTEILTIDGNITVGNGTSADSRLFVGLDITGYVGNGNLTLTGANGTGDSLFLNGYHPSDPVLGRLGHINPGATNTNYTGTLNITGGLAVTWGGRDLKIDGGANQVNVLDGSLDYTTTGFGWLDAGTASANHVVGADGSIIAPGVFTDAAGFDAWGVSAGADVGDIVVAADTGLTLQFANDGTNTTITAIPEPSSIALLSLAGLAFLRRRR